MSFVNVIQLQKRQKAPTPTNTNPNEELLAPFPTLPPVIDNNTINNKTLENAVAEGDDDGVNGPEMLGVAGGALVVIVLIVVFIRRKIVGDGKKSSDTERSDDFRSQKFRDDHNEQGKNSPIMIDHNVSQFISTSSPDSNDSHLGPPSVNNNFYSLQNNYPVDQSSRDISHSSPYLPQPSNSKQEVLSNSSDSYRGPSLDDDSSRLLQPQFPPNFQQNDPSYPSDSYKRSSKDGYSSPYLPQSHFTPNTPNTPNTSPYSPNTYRGPSQDDYPSPYLSHSPYSPNTPNTPNTPSYPPNTYQDDPPSPYLSQSQFNSNTPNTPNTPSYPPSPYLPQPPFTPNSQQREQSHQPNSYGSPQNDQSYRNSQHFQQEYSIDPTQGTLLSPEGPYQPQQYRTPPHSPHSLEDSSRSPSFSKSEPVPTNDQNSSSISYQDTFPVPNNMSNMNEDFSIISEATNNELKELDDLIASVIPSTFSKNFSHISDSSFTKLLSDIPTTNENSNRPDSQASSMYSVQPTHGMSQIEIAPENNISKVPPSNLNHDHDLPQSAAMRYIEPTQSNMVIERVDEPSGKSENQLNMTQTITTRFIQPSQSNMKIENVDGDTAFRSEISEISAPIMTGAAAQVSPKPRYDLDGLKRHAEKILNAKVEKKIDLNNESNSETKNNENVENDGKVVRKKSVRFRTEPNQEEAVKGSNPKKSILVNKNDAKKNNIHIQQSSTLESEHDSGDDYDFDISGYQDDTNEV
ncbi:unnamed protein product [Rhizophagus irregularis]|nr:unnamed protein product [Rhizophagus irregularis]CAB5363512.1 unnamed protein product [Rhizophagus irregularis]